MALVLSWHFGWKKWKESKQLPCGQLLYWINWQHMFSIQVSYFVNVFWQVNVVKLKIPDRFIANSTVLACKKNLIFFYCCCCFWRDDAKHMCVGLNCNFYCQVVKDAASQNLELMLMSYCYERKTFVPAGSAVTPDEKWSTGHQQKTVYKVSHAMAFYFIDLFHWPVVSCTLLSPFRSDKGNRLYKTSNSCFL